VKETTMRRVALVLLAFTTLAGCSWFRDPPPPEPARRVTPGSRIIYNSGVGDTVWTVCDKGNLVYLTEKSPAITVIPGGCPSGQP
jgi:hypothetical protein